MDNEIQECIIIRIVLPIDTVLSRWTNTWNTWVHIFKINGSNSISNLLLLAKSVFLLLKTESVGNFIDSPWFSRDEFLDFTLRVMMIRSVDTLIFHDPWWIVSRHVSACHTSWTYSGSIKWRLSSSHMLWDLIISTKNWSLFFMICSWSHRLFLHERMWSHTTCRGWS